MGGGAVGCGIRTVGVEAVGKGNVIGRFGPARDPDMLQMKVYIIAQS